ncbi:hypothetical protein JL720_9972 [Aureococcus anophagefferens]|nr:hypothetical protein JL720_9972 [Aureococcus anophagefferens]
MGLVPFASPAKLLFPGAMWLMHVGIAALQHIVFVDLLLLIPAWYLWHWCDHSARPRTAFARPHPWDWREWYAGTAGSVARGALFGAGAVPKPPVASSPVLKRGAKLSKSECRLDEALFAAADASPPSAGGLPMHDAASLSDDEALVYDATMRRGAARTIAFMAVFLAVWARREWYPRAPHVVVTDDSGATYATRLRFSAFRKAHGHLGHLGFPPTPASRHLGVPLTDSQLRARLAGLRAYVQGAVGLLPDASAGMGAFLEALDFVEEPWAAPRPPASARRARSSARESGGSAAWDPAAIFDFGRREDCLLFRLHSLARGDDDDRNCIGFCVLGNFQRPRRGRGGGPELRFQLLDHDNFATSTTIYAKLRVLTKARTRALSVVRKTIVYVYEKLDEDRARGGRRHRSFFDDVACTLCSTDGDGDDDGWRRAGCSFPAEGSFGEVARPMVIESRRSLDDFAPAPDGDVVLIDWHHPGGWDPVWDARDVESALVLEPKSHRDVFRSTIFHRYTTTDESLLGRDVASLHELANIEIHPPAAERSRSATDARARLGSGGAAARRAIGGGGGGGGGVCDGWYAGSDARRAAAAAAADSVAARAAATALVAAAAAYSRHDADVVYDFEGSLQGWGSAASSEMQLDVAARGGELLGTVRGGAFVSEPHLDSPPLALAARARGWRRRAAAPSPDHSGDHGTHDWTVRGPPVPVGNSGGASGDAVNDGDASTAADLAAGERLSTAGAAEAGAKPTKGAMAHAITDVEIICDAGDCPASLALRPAPATRASSGLGGVRDGRPSNGTSSRQFLATGLSPDARHAFWRVVVSTDARVRELRLLPCVVERAGISPSPDSSPTSASDMGGEACDEWRSGDATTSDPASWASPFWRLRADGERVAPWIVSELVMSRTASAPPARRSARVGAGRGSRGGVVASAWAGAGDGWALRDGDCDMEDAGGGGPKVFEAGAAAATDRDAGGTFLGYAFERAVAVRCVAICQSMLAANRAESVTLERSDSGGAGRHAALALPAAATIAKANPCKLSHTADDYDRKRRGLRPVRSIPAGRPRDERQFRRAAFAIESIILAYPPLVRSVTGCVDKFWPGVEATLGAAPVLDDRDAARG